MTQTKRIISRIYFWQQTQFGALDSKGGRASYLRTDSSDYQLCSPLQPELSGESRQHLSR
eukprot:4531469-Pyramimonas_sp.AAC.1